MEERLENVDVSEPSDDALIEQNIADDPLRWTTDPAKMFPTERFAEWFGTHLAERQLLVNLHEWGRSHAPESARIDEPHLPIVGKIQHEMGVGDAWLGRFDERDPTTHAEMK